MILWKSSLAFAVLLILTGTAWISSAHGTSPYFAYSLLALTACGLELADGSTLGFVFVILALPHLSWSDAILMASSALFINAVVRRNRPVPTEFVRSQLATSFAILGSQALFHAPNLQRFLIDPVRLMLAACVCYLMFRVMDPRKTERWSFPYYIVAALIAYAVPVTVALAPLVFVAWRSCRVYERRLEQQRRESQMAASLHLRTIETLALAIEAREQPLLGPSRRVQIYSVEMGKELKLRPMEIEALRAASVLYDIGELGIPEHIIGKSGPLTGEEFDKIKIHPQVGAGILESVKFPYPVAPIVLAHHEHWDGSGYPHGLKGEAIPIAARILAVVDALDALASPRHHRAALPLHKALEQVEREAGRAFDPRLTALVRKRHKRWEALVRAQPEESFIDSIFSARREEQIVYELANVLGSSLDLKETFAVLTPALQALIPFDTFAVWAEHNGVLSVEHAAGEDAEAYAALTLPSGEGVSGWVAFSGQMRMNEDASLELRNAPPSPEGTGAREVVLSAPLAADGLAGALSLYRSGARPFSNDEVRRLSVIAPKVAGAVANGMKFRRTSLAASTDGLTGLPNAAALGAHLETVRNSTALVVCDLDGFKAVNDRFGHIVGNRILQVLAERFRMACRGQDFVARAGGDEFVLLLDEIDPANLEGRIAQFREAVIEVGNHVCGERVLDASFGAAFYPRDGVTSDELLAFADKQMYTHKSRDRAGLRALGFGQAAG